MNKGILLLPFFERAFGRGIFHDLIDVTALRGGKMASSTPLDNLLVAAGSSAGRPQGLVAVTDKRWVRGASSRRRATGAEYLLTAYGLSFGQSRIS